MNIEYHDETNKPFYDTKNTVLKNTLSFAIPKSFKTRPHRLLEYEDSQDMEGTSVMFA